MQGRAFNKPPGPGSVSAQVQSIADRNEALGVPAVPGEAPVYITKDDAREAQHAESTIYGGQNPRGGIAAQMQVSESRWMDLSVPVWSGLQLTIGLECC
jgi:hypothetical protein